MTYFNPNLLPVQTSATNSVVRNLQQRFGEVYNVKDFGAKGDNVTNDTVAVQNAVNAAIAHLLPTTVYFPPGVYILSNTIVIGNNMHIEGSGPASTFIDTSVANGNVFNYTNPGLGFTANISISGFSFYDSGTGTNTAILINGVSIADRVGQVRISNCLFASFDYAVVLDYCTNVWLTDLEAAACGFGYVLNICGDTNISNCMAQNGSNYGFILYDTIGTGAAGEGHRIVNCSTNGQAGGILIAGTTWVSIVGCSMTTTSGTFYPLAIVKDPFSIKASSGIQVTGSNFDCANITMPAVQVDTSTSNIQLTNNFIAGSKEGLYLQGTQHVVSANTFTANTGVDIVLDTATKCAVMGNVGSSTGNAVSILEVNATDYNTIIGNILAGTITVAGFNTVSANNITSAP